MERSLSPAINILLIEPSRPKGTPVADIVAECKTFQVFLTHVSDISRGTALLRESDFDICLLSGVPRSEAVQFCRSNTSLTAIPVIILSDSAGKDSDTEYLQAGASDFLLRGSLHHSFLERSIRYALGRRDARRTKLAAEKKVMYSWQLKALGNLTAALADDLTDSLDNLNEVVITMEETLPEDSPLQPLISRARSACYRSTLLADHLLVYAQDGSNERISLSLQQLTIETISVLSRILPANIRLTSSIESRDDFYISGNQSELRQALINIATNSVAAMPQGGRLHFTFNELDISSEDDLNQSNNSGHYYVLRVKDSGHGIKPADIPRIFDPDFTTATTESGLGLGLPAVASIMEDHNGWIKVESQRGTGTVFKLFFPATSAPEENSVDKKSDLNRERGRILLIHPDMLMTQMLTLYLEAGGFKVTSFESPTEALTYLLPRQASYTALILDSYSALPEGGDCLRTFQGTPCQLTTVICAPPQLSDREKTLLSDSGADYVFTAPDEFPLIVTTLSEVIDSASGL